MATMAPFEQVHHQMLAQLMQDAKVQHETDQQGGLDMLERMLADMLARHSIKFDRAQFVAACQPGANALAYTEAGARAVAKQADPPQGTNPGLRRSRGNRTGPL